MKSKFKIIFYILLSIILSPDISYALNLDGTDSSHSGKSLTNNSIKQIINIFTYVGVFALLVGLIQLVLSIKDENADGKVKGTLTVIVGFALIALDAIITSIGFGYS